ncbi:hypothetical protein KBC03_06555 [Patescibacteria group bacterium]|nr:hypothetical protein [Patescibacteria group bacterium]
MPHPASTFLLRVKDDEMIEQGIVEGDYIIVDRDTHEIKTGDILVLDGPESTQTFTLQFIEEQTTYEREILGKVVGVFRRMH